MKALCFCLCLNAKMEVSFKTKCQLHSGCEPCKLVFKSEVGLLKLSSLDNKLFMNFWKAKYMQGKNEVEPTDWFEVFTSSICSFGSVEMFCRFVCTTKGYKSIGVLQFLLSLEVAVCLSSKCEAPNSAAHCCVPRNLFQMHITVQLLIKLTVRREEGLDRMRVIWNGMNHRMNDLSQERDLTDWKGNAGWLVELYGNREQPWSLLSF